MKKLTLSGKLEIRYVGSFQNIFLLQDDGYSICLNFRLSELQCNSKGGVVQVNYHTSEKKLTLSEIKEANILRISGAIDSDYEANDYTYSSWTSGTDYETNLKIGGHDFFNELCELIGKYIWLEINYETA